MKLRIPPPILFLLSTALMWVLSHFIAFGHMVILFRRPVFYSLIIIALVVTFLAMSSFKKVQTTIDPLKPEKASSLVTDGIYSWTRNPMYLALLLLLGAWAVYLGSGLNVAVMLLFYVYITEFQIKPEEEALLGKFGEAYTNYTSRVRRWL